MSVRDRGRCPFPVRHLIRSLPTKWERVFNGSLLQRTKSPDYKLWSLKSLSHRIRGYRRLRPGELDRRYWLQRAPSQVIPKARGLLQKLIAASSPPAPKWGRRGSCECGGHSQGGARPVSNPESQTSSYTCQQFCAQQEHTREFGPERSGGRAGIPRGAAWHPIC